MKRIRVFLRELFSAPRDATSAAREPVRAKRPGPTPVAADVASSGSPWMVIENRTRFREDEDRAYRDWFDQEERAKVEQAIDPERGCIDRSQVDALIGAIVAPAWEGAWPLVRLSREQAFAALDGGLDRIVAADGRIVVRLLLEEVRASLAQAERWFVDDDPRAGCERLRQARAALGAALRDAGPSA
jgi:hypothetical protein